MCVCVCVCEMVVVVGGEGGRGARAESQSGMAVLAGTRDVINNYDIVSGGWRLR
jgi:hypothetical protein